MSDLDVSVNGVTVAAGHLAGHNLPDGAETGDELLSYVERWESCEAQKRAAADDLKELKAEAKGRGFDPKVLAELVKRRNEDRERERARELFEIEIEHCLRVLREAEGRAEE